MFNKVVNMIMLLCCKTVTIIVREGKPVYKTTKLFILLVFLYFWYPNLTTTKVAKSIEQLNLKLPVIQRIKDNNRDNLSSLIISKNDRETRYIKQYYFWRHIVNKR